VTGSEHSLVGRTDPDRRAPELAAIDRISLEHHGLSKRAKDYGSAAVTLSLLVCAMVWITLICRLFA
jgi:hypothetical protein